MFAISIAGIGVAGYLTYVHYAGIEPVCTTGGCAKVQSSTYAELAGIPVALLGLIGYLLIGSAVWAEGEEGRAGTAALALVGAGFSLYLTYLELFVIDAICQWCVVSAVLMVCLATLAVARLLRPPPSPA